jgi:hypothetical protein
MMNKREGLPFKNINEPTKIDVESKESDVFEFQVEGNKDMVYKELRNTDIDYWKKVYEDVESLENLASALKQTYEVLKEYLGDNLVDTHFVIANNRNNEPTILKVQAKINGKRIVDLEPEEITQDIIDQQESIWARVQEAEDDQRLDKLKFHVEYAQYRLGEATLKENQIINESGSVKVIDW